MEFISTRGKCKVSSAAEAIVKGLADDGGLFVPATFPDFSGKLGSLCELDYPELACEVLHSYLEEYDKQKLLDACKKAYAKFDDSPAPIVKIDEKYYIMELFHGPTLAFKDIALTILPYLLREGANICGLRDEILILVATSGDTGKAALEGFKDAEGIKINVFYPSDGVSDMQKLQMRTQEGNNVNVVAVKGNFDDCQTAVKKIFSDKGIETELKKNGIVLSSANSINFGRLAPQITYYFSAYFDLVNSNEIKLGDKVDFVVPTGNFGDILAGYYAKKMGLPVGKLVCASNSNNVLTEFFNNGTYNSDREFYKTISPSMDILISSNLERLLFEIGGRNAEETATLMQQLKTDKRYTVSKKEKAILDEEFYADFCDEEECKETIADFFEENGYVLDTHTAVAVNVSDSYIGFTGSDKAVVILSTANPYKFSQNVLNAITGKQVKDAFSASIQLNQVSAMEIPKQISELQEKQVRFNEIIDKTETFIAIKEFLNIK
ncbi:MAG: threonine synthase [Clostridia bacterium]|nr:threonine synthase [Clostridia bacterium]